MISRLFVDGWRFLHDRLAVWQLRREVQHLKARNYDLCVQTVQGLRRALSTQRRAQDELRTQLAGCAEQVEALRAEYAALAERLDRSGAEFARSERLALFKELRPVLIQLPTMRAAVEYGAEVSARDVLELLAPLDQFLSDLGFQCIGVAGAETGYDPRLHRVVGRGADDVQPHETVRVRYVGYRLDGEVVTKAEVTRVHPRVE